MFGLGVEQLQRQGGHWPRALGAGAAAAATTEAVAAMRGDVVLGLGHVRERQLRDVERGGRQRAPEVHRQGGRAHLAPKVGRGGRGGHAATYCQLAQLRHGRRTNPATAALGAATANCRRLQDA